MPYAVLEPRPQALPSPSADKPPARPLDPRIAELGPQLPPHLQLRRIIGEGGSSVVFEAFHARLKVPVAVKLLSVRGEFAEEAYTRMMREAELYAHLDDPRIPRVYDVNELPNGTPYVVMEMVPGDSLEDLIQREGALPISMATFIAEEVLATLANVHARGVLHRDVKPANVILNQPPSGPCQVRLVDFGIAKMSTYGTGQEAVTQRGTLVGTPQYMPPERLTGHEADATSDTYAVGIMLYEMLAGVVPFGGPNLGAVMASVLRDTPVPLLERRAEVSDGLADVVMRAVSRVAGDRFASAQAMAEALQALGERHDPPSGLRALEEAAAQKPVPAAGVDVWAVPPDDAPAPKPARARPKRAYLRAGLVGVFLLGVGFGGWVYAGREAPALSLTPSQDSIRARERDEGPAARPPTQAIPIAAPPEAAPSEPAALPEAGAEPTQVVVEQLETPTREARKKRAANRRDTAARKDQGRSAPSGARAENGRGESPRAPAKSAPARPAVDYAKLLPDNPY